jgi:hypothetical protein
MMRLIKTKHIRWVAAGQRTDEHQFQPITLNALKSNTNELHTSGPIYSTYYLLSYSVNFHVTECKGSSQIISTFTVRQLALS